MSVHSKPQHISKKEPVRALAYRQQEDYSPYKALKKSRWNFTADTEQYTEQTAGGSRLQEQSIQEFRLEDHCTW